ncbi:probable peroxisomal acyl-coenzyme A oxidase 1 [Aricia agestis]|uniref:probable peroxisomal acyl-coenzyme A oxidase 1 n=1 Tax=Aricia agestis TaxID=91739 RepID=UPI001C205D76|nr:probable peroxisomal acyl-coenzyme A oxidase 1 [Aricia agestis]
MAVNTDLKNEREKCTFKLEELINYIDGGPEKTKERRYRHNLMLSHKELYEGVPDVYLSHKEKYENIIKKSVKFFSTLKKLQEGSTLDQFSENLTTLLRSHPFMEGTALGLNFIIFLPAILGQGDDEQQAHWIKRIWNWEIIGSFAQTELGHGTFIRGLETTATYDEQTKEFVLNTPTLTAYKWWPGAMGHTANYCIVAAQLYTKGKCYGLHYFVIQLRDEETHMPLPGIKVGEIGVKLGYNGTNNGFLGLDNVRVPRNRMLMKHAQVLEDGTYVKSKNSKLNYGTMMYVRMIIVFDTVQMLARVVTVAVRYSAVRRQTTYKTGEPENQILDYHTQRHKLFIAIAATHALRSAVQAAWAYFNTVNVELNEGNYKRLPEIHAQACCLKAVATSDATRLITACKLSCGGHGCMLSSGLPYSEAYVAGAAIYEGENTVLFLQTARFLAKAYQQVDNAELTPAIQYLKDARNHTLDKKWENTIEYIIKGFQVVAMTKVKQCVECMQRKVESGATFEHAWNTTSVRLVAAAEAHARLLIITSFDEEVRRASLSPELKTVMRQLADLYAVYWTLENLGDLLQVTCMNGADVQHLRSWYEDLLEQLRPNAVGLVDAFDIDDRILGSTLGASDGRVYERLMEEAQKSPLNQEPVNYTFEKYLKPFLKGKL